jgi:hypothetical protein
VKTEWIREIRDECLRQGVAFFFKQYGGVRSKSGGRILDGQTWSEYPHSDIVMDKIDSHHNQNTFEKYSAKPEQINPKNLI